MEAHMVGVSIGSIKEVVVHGHRTMGDALREGQKTLQRVTRNFFPRFLGGNPLIDDAFSNLLNEFFWPNNQDASISYSRVCGFALLEERMPRSEIYKRLDPTGWHPASVSEGMSYLAAVGLSAMQGRRIIHLATEIFSESFEEQRLVTDKTLRSTVIPCVSSTVLTPDYGLVVVKVNEGYHEVVPQGHFSL